MNRSALIAIVTVIVLTATAPMSSCVQAGVTITPTAGFTIAWDGNDGDFHTDSIATAPANLATDAGATAFSSGEHVSGQHLTSEVNDGLYGNYSSWIGSTASPNCIGINLNGTYDLNAIAWGRDTTAASFAGFSYPYHCMDQRSFWGLGVSSFDDPVESAARIIMSYNYRSPSWFRTHDKEQLNASAFKQNIILWTDQLDPRFACGTTILKATTRSVPMAPAASCSTASMMRNRLRSTMAPPTGGAAPSMTKRSSTTSNRFNRTTRLDVT